MILVSSDTSVSQSSGLTQTISHYNNKSTAQRTVKEAPTNTADFSSWNTYFDLVEAAEAEVSPYFFLPNLRPARLFFPLLFPPVWMETTSSERRGRVSGAWTRALVRLTNRISV